MKTITLNTSHPRPPTWDFPYSKTLPSTLPTPKSTQSHPANSTTSTSSSSSSSSSFPSPSSASLTFIGTATTLLQWAGLTLLTDPNFLHAGDHVHLGPGVTGTRVTNPSIDLHDLPNIDVVLLSHYHADHFDELVEKSLRRDLPIVTTPHAFECLVTKKSEGEKFTAVEAVDTWDEVMLDFEYPPFPAQQHSTGKVPRVKVTGMPGKHVPDGVLSVLNELASAVPPVNGWIVEMGHSQSQEGEGPGEFKCGYRIYISGDTLMVNELSQIPERYNTQLGKGVDLMLVHLGGTMLPSPNLPLLMVTMDAEQGIQLIQLIQPDVTIPIHYDDYDVFKSPLSDFKEEVEKAGLGGKVVYLDRGDEFVFSVK